MKTFKFYFLLFFLLSVHSCDVWKEVLATEDDGEIEVIFLQINDVYEIAPLEGGKKGGMARVATLRNQLMEENKNTLTVLAGDFLNPSVIGTLPLNVKEKIQGKQMVDVMNATGVDVVTFGNHEFDIKEADLQKRINESNFQWVSSNVLQKTAKIPEPFYKMVDGKKESIPESWIWEVSDADGTTIKIGIMTATINSNPQEWVVYEDAQEEAIKVYNDLLKKTDLVIGVTHLSIEEDMKLAAYTPKVPLIMGGHEHANMMHQVDDVVITKADANAKSAYVHRLKYNKTTKQIELTNKLIQINEKIELDSAVNVVVKKWQKIADDKFSAIGFDPNEVVATVDEPFDGKDTNIRYKQTNLGHLVTEAMTAATEDRVDATIINSGTFRIDDELSGPITQFDIIRTMPFGGKIYEVEMTGKLLQTVLNEGQNSQGAGAYLQWDHITYDEATQTWMIQKKALNVNETYKIALNDYLLLGFDIPSLKADSPGIKKVSKPDPNDKTDLRNDIRSAVIEYLKANFN